MLCVNAGVVAVDVVGNLLRRGGQQGEVKPRLQLGQKALGGPAFLEEEVLHAGLGAVFAQFLLAAEDLRHGARDADDLIGQNKGIQAHGQVRLFGEAAADAHRVANLAVELGRSEGNVVDLRVRTPRGTAGDADFELAREIVEFRIAGQLFGDFGGQRRGDHQLIGGHAGQRAAGHVAQHIAAGADGREADGVDAHRRSPAAIRWSANEAGCTGGR